MTVSLEQKVDFLLKKLGYSVTKTGLAEDESLAGTKKAPFAEALASPLVVPNTSIWQESELIPATPPAADTDVVGVYNIANAVQMTADPTVTGNRTFIAHSGSGNTSSPILGDWIDVQFGSEYIVNVYKGDPDNGGVKLSAAGSGSNDTWFFDYSAGVLNFNGSVVPSGVTSTNVYIVAYRYIGAKGVAQSSVATALSTHAGDIDLIKEKLISMDERIENLVVLTHSCSLLKIRQRLHLQLFQLHQDLLMRLRMVPQQSLLSPLTQRDQSTPLRVFHNRQFKSPAVTSSSLMFLPSVNRLSSEFIKMVQNSPLV